MAFLESLRAGLSKTRKSITDGLDSLFGDYSQVDEDFFEELEEILVMADMGMPAAQKILDEMREKIREEHIKDPAELKELMAAAVAERMRPAEDAYAFEEERSVLLLVGVNGVGKTTTCGKLAGIYTEKGKSVILCGADTFRAAAAEQLAIWSERTGAPLISQKEGADPASVVYDGAAAFQNRKADMLICDTAGRLHNKKNLMNELARIRRILDRELPGVRQEVLLVLDASTGQNALSQAREFEEAASPTGIILTKMDGTARGGIAVAIADQLNIPIKFIGVGEKTEDLQRFDAESFVRAILG